MMKRMLAVLLAVLCLMMGTACAAGPVIPNAEPLVNRLVNMVSVKDVVYLLTTTGKEMKLWRWTKEMPQAEVVDETLLNADRLTPTEAQADADHALSYLFTDGEQVYGYNGVENTIFTIDVEADHLTYNDINTLADVKLNSAGPVKMVKIGSWLLMQEVDRNSRKYEDRLLIFNLEKGTVKQAVLDGLEALDLYRDGKAIVVCMNDARERIAYTYDPETDQVDALGVLSLVKGKKPMAYSSSLDMLVYLDETRIMGWNPTGDEQIGFLPDLQVDHLVAVEGSVVARGVNDVKAAKIEKGFSTEHSLRLLNGTMYDSAIAFNEQHPEVPFYYQHSENLVLGDNGADYISLLKQEKDAPDLIWLRVNDGDYDALKKGGFLMDLSANPEIRAYVDVLYPLYKELSTDGDAIYGVPVSANSYSGWFINKSVMTAMGLTAEDIPTSLSELCAFAEKWNDEWAEKYPHFTLLNNTQNYRERFLDAMVEGWTDYCAYHGEPVNFDHPIFIEMMEALEAADFTKLDAALRQTNPEVSEYKQALIWTGCKDVANWACYMEEYSDRIFIPLSLIPGTPYITGVGNVGIWAVNAKSENGEYASALLAETITRISAVSAYALRSDCTEPVFSEYSAENLKNIETELKLLEESRDQSVNKAAVEARIEAKKSELIERRRTLYEVFPSAIDNYVNVIMPASYIELRDHPDLEETRRNCMELYVDGKITLASLIRRLNEAETMK